jgi:maltose O-acetyltransferase
MIVGMGEQRDLMRDGHEYRPGDPELAGDRLRSQLLVERFNLTSASRPAERQALLRDMVREIGEGSVILPRVQIEYGYHVSIGAGSFINYDGILLDCGPITIGDSVQIGPRVQLLTALHPMADHERRRQGWESTAPITIGDNVWFGGGVTVCAGVTIGHNTVIGAGSVVTRDIPPHVFAAGNPCRPIRELPAS